MSENKKPIARTAFELSADEWLRVFTDTMSAHLKYAESGTIHGNISPYVIFADSRTGRGFLADYEYPTITVAPNGYIPLAVSTQTLVRPTMEKAYREREKEKRKREKAGQEGDLADDDMGIDPAQGAPSIIPLTHGYEAEDPLVPRK